MARKSKTGIPNVSAQRKSVDTFISRWQNKKKQEAIDRKEQAAREVTNNRAENENKMISILERINFVDPDRCKIIVSLRRQAKSITNRINELESEIEENLDLGVPTDKQEEEIQQLKMKMEGLKDTIPGLEEARNEIVRLLRHSPYIGVNIKEMDTMLIELCNRFAGCVHSGNIFGAYAAKAALYHIITEVRYNIPNATPQFLSNYLEKSNEYIEAWINVTSSSANVDEVQERVDKTDAEFGVVKRELLDKKKAMRERLKSDNAFAKAFLDILDDKSPKDVSTWTDTMKEARVCLVDMRMLTIKQKLKFNLLDARKREFLNTKHQLSILQDGLKKPYLNEDPNLAAKTKETMQKIFRELAEADRQTEEMLASLEFIEGNLIQLNEAPGAVKLRETLAKEVENQIREIANEQKEELAQSDGQAYKRLTNNMGVLSDEELDNLKQKQRVELKEEVRETEQQVNYVEE